MLKKEIFPRQGGESDDLPDEPDDYRGTGLNEPKRSPMRRKEKYRAKGFKPEKKQKNRKRNHHHKDYGFWEE